MSIAYVEVRSQHARGSGRNHGPDTYVAVQIVPEGTDKLVCLNRKVAQRRGIQLIHFGEGYREHRGCKSSLGRALLKAKSFAEEHNQQFQPDVR